MTEKLFYEDGYLNEFTAKVTECLEQETKSGKQYKVVLDRTLFFPEEGGQYADTGLLNDVNVLDVQEKDDVIYHITDAPLEVGSEVKGSLHWDERFMKMQQHSGEHIVSGLVHARFGYDNVGFHLGSEDSTMDFNGEITREELREIELEANKAVAANFEVQVTYPTKEELKELQYRSKIEIEGQVRIVTFPGYDVCACCAPHVTRTGEIGLIKLTNVQHYKGGVRVTMLCGFRALSDYAAKEERARAISTSLCAPDSEIHEAVEQLKAERDQLKYQLAEMHQQILKMRLDAQLEKQGLSDRMCVFEVEVKADDMRFLMNRVLEKNVKLCLVVSEDGQGGFRYIAGSKEEDVRPIAKMLNERFEGRGGGKQDMVQGACKNFTNKQDIINLIG